MEKILNKNDIEMKTKIVETFVKLFENRPEQALTAKDIANAANIDMPTFRKYFKNIDEICDVIIDHAANKLINFIFKDYADYICNLRAKQDLLIAEFKKNASFYLALSNFEGIEKLIAKVAEYANEYYDKNLASPAFASNDKQNELYNYGIIMEVLGVYIAKLQGRFKASWSEVADWVTKVILDFNNSTYTN